MVTIDALDIFAFVVFAVLFAVIVTAVVVLGGLPGKIAAQRGHPQAKAVAAAGWISLFTVFTLWPLAFIWAFYQPRPNAAPVKGESQP